MTVELSIVIPAYNEERRVGRYLDEIHAHITQADIVSEIIVVDDGSVDGTAGVVRNRAASHPEIRLIRIERNRGKGAAVRRGMMEATGRYCLFADADGSTPFRESGKLLDAIRRGADIAVGSRAFPRASNVRALPHRVLAGRLLQGMQLLLAPVGVRDTQCGFKAFTAAAAGSLFPRLRENGFAFDIPLLSLARRLHLRIDEIPIDWHHQPAGKVHLLMDGFRITMAILRSATGYIP